MSYPHRPSPSPPNWETVQGQLSRWLAEPLAWLGGRRDGRSALDVHEDQDGWTVEVRLPGVASDEVHVEAVDHELVIRARHTEDDQASDGGSRKARHFAYRMPLPYGADIDHIGASMDHGLLIIRLPRSPARYRRIEVGSGAV
jgi:HSP20 family protein